MKKIIFQVFSLLLLFIFVLFPFSGSVQVKALAQTQAGYENPGFELTDIDDLTVSTTASAGQASIIIFGKTNCGITQRIIRDIAGSEWVSRSDIRVVFVECNSASMEATKAFGQTYGCSDMIFCYDNDGYKNSRVWNEYCDIGAEMGVTIGSLPTTVLVDENNYIRKVLSGFQSAASLYNEIVGNLGGETGDAEKTDTVLVETEGTESYGYAREILELVNQARTAEGLPVLALDESLLDAAMQRAAEISLYYSHTRPDGTQCFTVSDRGTRKSENIAMGYTTPEAVMNAWLGSPGHYANIMDADMKSIGIGCFKDSAGVWNWVQFFDNVAPSGTIRAGDSLVVKSVSIRKDVLHLWTEAEQQFAELDINKQVKMSIYQCDEKTENRKVELLSSCFDFRSSKPGVAQVDESGNIMVKGGGTVAITASLKSDASIFVERSVKVADNSMAEPPTTDEGVPKPSIPPSSERKPTKSEPISLADVSGLKAVSDKNAIRISWGGVAGAEGYILYQYNNKKKVWDEIASVAADRVSYTVKKTKAGTGYRFAVRAYMTRDGRRITSPKYVAVYTAAAPGIVKFNISARKRKAALKWSKVKGATGYIVYYKTGKKASWKKLGKTKKTSFTKKKLSTGKTYFFMVKAYKSYKGKNYIGSGKTKKVLIK